MMVPMKQERSARGLSLLETALSVLLISVLLSILLPALSTARSASYRDRCQSNQRQISDAWQLYLQEHNLQFPTVPVQPGWFYGGMRFSAVSDVAFPDTSRPLTGYLPQVRTNDTNDIVWCCPSDHGITVSTGRRTAFRSFGTSYRANSSLLWYTPPDASAGATVAIEGRGLHRSEITTAASRLLLMGDPVWHEVAESTGRNADWHGVPGAGNFVFLDGSVRFLTIKPRQVVGPVVFDPMMPGATPATPPPNDENPADHQHPHEH